MFCLLCARCFVVSVLCSSRFSSYLLFFLRRCPGLLSSFSLPRSLPARVSLSLPLSSFVSLIPGLRSLVISCSVSLVSVSCSLSRLASDLLASRSPRLGVSFLLRGLTFCVGIRGAVAAAGDHFGIGRWRPLSCAVASGRRLRRSGGGGRRAPSLAQVREVSVLSFSLPFQDSADHPHIHISQASAMVLPFKKEVIVTGTSSFASSRLL